MMREGRRIGTPVLAGMAVLGLLWIVLITFGQRWNPVAIDFELFWRAARRPMNRIYEVGAYFVYPPPAIILIKPLGLISLWSAYFIWISVSALAFFVAAMRLTNRRSATLALFSSSSLQNLIFGQTPMLLSAVFLFGLTLPSLMQGLIIGYLTTVKPQLFMMAPLVMLVRRDWSSLAGMVLGGLGAVLLSVAIYGIQPWRDWIAVIPSWAQAQADLDVLRNSVTLREMGLRFGLYPRILWAAEVFAVVFAVYRLSCKLEGANLAALIIGASALTAPYALPHDLVGAMPALAAFMLSEISALGAVTAAMIFMGLLLPMLLPGFALFVAWHADDRWRSSISLKAPASLP